MESVHGRLWKSWLWRVQIQGGRLAFAFGELEILCSFIGAMVVDTGVVLGKLPTAGESSELWRNSVLWSQARGTPPHSLPV